MCSRGSCFKTGPGTNRRGLASAPRLLGLLLTLATIATTWAEGFWAAWRGSMDGPTDGGQTWGFVTSEGALLPYEFRQVALGSRFSVGLRMDGTLFAWGLVPEQFPYALSGVRSVALSGSNGYAVLEDGTVASLWGFASSFSNVEEIALNLRGGMARKSDGTLVVWGEAGTPPMIRNAAAIALRDNLAAVLRSDGSVLAWDFKEGILAPLPATFRNVTQLHPGGGGLYALRSDGTVAGWGSIASKMPADLEGVTSLATGDSFVLALKTDGTVVAWGTDPLGYTPTQVPVGLSQVTYIAASRFAAFAVQADGTVVSWSGSEPLAEILTQGVSRIVTQTDSGVLVCLGRPTQPVIVQQPTSQTAHAFQGVRFEVKATGFGLSYQWRYGQSPLRGVTNRVYRVGELQVGGAPADFGAYSAVVMNPVGQTVVSDAVRLRVTGTVLPGTMVEWGPEGMPSRHPPDEVFGRVISMDTGATLSTALLSDGSVQGWMSSGGFLQQPVPGGLRPDAIAAGRWEWLQLTPDGLVKAWDWWGTRRDLDQFPGISAISASEEHVALLDERGSVWRWNPFAGSGGAILYPVSGIRAVAAGNFGVAMLRADGSVLVGGPNGAPTAAAPAGLTNVVAIAGGASHVVALRADGTVTAWNAQNATVIAVPSGLSGVVAIAAGDYHTLALRRDGTLVGWGQVGTVGADPGTTIWRPYSVPSGLRSVSSIAAGGVWSSALLGGPAPPRIQLESADGSTTAVWHQGTAPATLESAERIEDAAWTALPEPPVHEGLWRRTVIPTHHEHRFFRLATP